MGGILTINDYPFINSIHNGTHALSDLGFMSYSRFSCKKCFIFNCGILSKETHEFVEIKKIKKSSIDQ